MGRTITYRKLTSRGWANMPDGSCAGIVKVEQFADQEHQQPIGKPEYYYGSTTKPDESDHGAYYDARTIVNFGRKIPEELIQEMAKCATIDKDRRAIDIHGF